MMSKNIFSLTKASVFLFYLFFTVIGNATSKRNLLTDLKEASNTLMEFEATISGNGGLNEKTIVELSNELSRMYQFLYLADANVYDVNEVKQQAFEIIKTNFELRRQLRKKIAIWNENDFLKKSANGFRLIESVRNMLRAGRYMEDIIGEMVVPRNPVGETREIDFLSASKYSKNESFISRFSKKMSLFTSSDLPSDTLSKNHQFDMDSFRSGDIILMRGSSPVSAAIARVTDSVSQFSHVAIVYVDEKTNKKYIVESLIEKGSIIRPLAEAIDHSLPRVVVYRFNDAVIASRAATEIYQYVKTETKNGTVRLGYDFSMNLKDHKRIFCSELVSLAFDLAAQKLGISKTFQPVPYFSNAFLSRENRSFLRNITIDDSTQIAFAPGDIDVDPRFDLVAEFRDYSKTETVRMHDLIFDKVFEWTEKEQRELKASWWMEPLAFLAYQASKVEPLKNLLTSFGLPVDRDVKPQLIRTILIMALTKAKFEKELKKFSEGYAAKYGVAPPPRLIYLELDKLKKKNGENYLKLFPKMLKEKIEKLVAFKNKSNPTENPTVNTNDILSTQGLKVACLNHYQYAKLF